MGNVKQTMELDYSIPGRAIARTEIVALSRQGGRRARLGPELFDFTFCFQA
jgi:hypothetical protein